VVSLFKTAPSIPVLCLIRVFRKILNATPG